MRKPLDEKQFNRLKELVDIIEQSLGEDMTEHMFRECVVRITEYQAEGHDSENAIERTYDDFIWMNSDIEGESEFSEEDVQLIKTHLHHLMNRNANYALYV